MSELWQGVTFCTPEYAEAAERWAARVRELGGEPVVAGDKEFREARSIWYRARASWGNVFTYTLIDLLAESRAKAKDA